MNKRVLSNGAMGNFIREKRVELGYSQEELATKLGVSKTAVSNWENGNAIVDVKFLVPLSNIFSVVIDDILFPGRDDSAEYPYSDYLSQFQKVAHFEETNPLICKKMLDMYVDCKIKLLKQIRKYKESPTDENWRTIAQSNKFGFSIHWDILGRRDIDQYDFDSSAIEDELETLLGPLFLQGSGIDEIDSIRAKIPHLFHDSDVDGPAYYAQDVKRARKQAMLNFVLFVGGERIFRKYISTFSKKYQNDLFKEIAVSCDREASSFTKDEKKALKALWREGAELWENGRNTTDELVRKLF